MLCGIEFNKLQNFLRSTFCKNWGHVRRFLALDWHPHHVVSLSAELADRESCPATAAGRVQAPALASPTRRAGQALLGDSASVLAFVEEDFDCGYTRHCGALASGWLSALLAAHLSCP